MKRILFVVVAIVFLAFGVQAGDKEKVSFNVKGMHCSSCASMIKKSIRRVNGVESVSVSLEKSRVEVEYDTTLASADNIIRAIQTMGYRVQPDTAAWAVPAQKILHNHK